MKSSRLGPLVTLLFMLGLNATPTFAETLSGHVLRVEDGDTISILDTANQQRKVKLVGIDAPDRMQAFGARSQANLSSLLFDQDVTVIWNQRDRVGTLLGKVIVSPPQASCRLQPACPKTLDAGLQQITDGMAWWYAQSLSDQNPPDRAEYEHAEFDAKIHRRGLWADSKPIPPWTWPGKN